ncbi:MAG: TetR/AcrR family transcriptional regulator [Alphaproteobacteria bacterium]|nr:TetR/AcrR family transcriptional regulator [Alphaproteobacteria bacterium]
MVEDLSKSIRLKKFIKEQMRQSLLKVGRRLVVEKGVDYLTARKLSDAANASIGVIYNTFSTMDNFIIEQNIQTFDELYKDLSSVVLHENPYVNLNYYADVFGRFVLANKNLWMLLYKDMLLLAKSSIKYRRKIILIEALLYNQLGQMFGGMKKAERKIALQILALSIFAVSGFLVADSDNNLYKLSKLNICKLLLNTYLAGLQGLKKVNK